jgi:hypothetical protein
VADPYVPGLAVARSVYDQGIAPVARSVYDQGIAPFAQRAQDYLKGAAGIPGAIKDYAVETVQSEAGPTNKVMADILTLGQGMRQGVQENPVRAIAEANPLIGTASGVFESNRLMNQAEQAEQAGDFKKAQTLREIGAAALLSMIPGVFHGSPYKFNKFSTRNVGTGDGAKMYGHGMYFTNDISLAKNYVPRDFAAENKLSDLYDAASKVDDTTSMEIYERAMLHDTADEIAEHFNDPDVSPYYRSEDVEAALDVVRDIEKNADASLYQVDIDVNEEDLLDYNRPLNEQSKEVQNILRQNKDKLTKDLYLIDFEEMMNSPSQSGGGLLAKMSTELGGDRQASEYLSKLGVPGLRYGEGYITSATPTTAAEPLSSKGHRNYVIFDEDVIQIKTRNGEAVLPEQKEIILKDLTETPPQTPDAFDEKLQSIYRNIMTNKDAPVDTPVLPEQSRTYGYDSPQDIALRNKLKKKTAGGASADIKFSMDRDAPGMDFESWNMINDPEHFIKSRGKITNIEQMSPTEYIERVSKDVFPTFGEAEIRRQRERTGKIPLMMEAMQEGTEFGLPTIHYDDGTRKFPSQEGLHRAMAAERLGVPEIPVAIHQLDRSPAARAARADEFGFDMDNIYYHGTSSDFTEFQPSTVGDLGGGIYITPNPEKASGYAAMRKFMKRQTNNASPNVLPLRIKSDLNYLDLQGRSILPFDDVRINNLKEQGYDGIRQFDADGNVLQINVFDPKNIRSINADFNPMRMNEADLQAGIASLGTREGIA